MVKGSDAALLYALPVALIVGAAVGFVNGAGVVLLGVSPIVMTLAMNGILQGAALVYSNGTPDGFSSPLLRLFMTDHELPVTPSSFSSRCLSYVAVLLLGKTPFGRRIYSIGNGERVAALSGVPVERHADRRLYALGRSARRSSGRCSPGFRARRASAWATNICCPRSRSW